MIPKERKIRSIVGGLETSLGTTLWEPLAKALAIENNFEIVKPKEKIGYIDYFDSTLLLTKIQDVT